MAIQSIYIARAKSEPMIQLDGCEMIAGKGIAGDRYADGKGFYSGVKEWDAHVTLIEGEAIDAVNTGSDEVITPEMLRRNLVTDDIRLDSLVGKPFKIGENVVLEGRKKWPPCRYIVKLNDKPEILKYFAYAGGIGANVIVGGSIKTGDQIELIEIYNGR